MQLFLKNTFQAEKKIAGCQVKCIMKSTFSGQDHSDQLGSITTSTSFTSLVDLSYYTEKKRKQNSPIFCCFNDNLHEALQLSFLTVWTLAISKPSFCFGFLFCLFFSAAGPDSEPPNPSGICFAHSWGWNWFTNHFCIILMSDSELS